MITQKQRDAYRFALEDKGVPEVIAYMAACNTYTPLDWYEGPLDPGFLIIGGFGWADTPEGHDFWSAISNEIAA